MAYQGAFRDLLIRSYVSIHLPYEATVDSC